MRFDANKSHYITARYQNYSYPNRVGIIIIPPETVLHHGFGGLLYGWHRNGITFLPPPTPKPSAVRPTFRSTEKHHSYAVYKLTYRLGYSIIILIRVCLKSGRQKITDTKSCKRKDDTVDIRRFIFSVLLYGSVLYSIFHLP